MRPQRPSRNVAYGLPWFVSLVRSGYCQASVKFCFGVWCASAAPLPGMAFTGTLNNWVMNCEASLASYDRSTDWNTVSTIVCQPRAAPKGALFVVGSIGSVDYRSTRSHSMSRGLISNRRDPYPRVFISRLLKKHSWSLSPVDSFITTYEGYIGHTVVRRPRE